MMRCYFKTKLSACFKNRKGPLIENYLFIAIIFEHMVRINK